MEIGVFLCWRAPAAFWQGRRVDCWSCARMLRQQVGVLSHAIAGSLDLDDHGVVKKAIEQRGGHDRIAKDIAPFGKAAVGCEDHGALFISRVDELEEEVASPRRDGEIPDLVHDEQ